MKKIILVTFILFSVIRTFAQDTIKVYLNESNSVTQKDSAKYIREAIIKDNRYYITDKYIDGVVYGYYELSSLTPSVFDGLSITYNENNSYYSKGNYKNDIMSGLWVYYDEVENVDTVFYKELKAKKIKRAQYHRNSMKTKELGYQVIDSLDSFLKNNFHLPPRARDNNNNFQAIINCTVGKEGRILWHEVASPNIHKDIYQEIERIMDMFQFNHQAGKAFEISAALSYGIKPESSENTIYFIVEEMPTFKHKNYNNSFKLYVQDNLNDIFGNCSGTAAVKFVVEKDGSLSNIVIEKGVEDCHECQDEIKRIFRSCPKWIPGKQRDEPVRVRLATFISMGKK
uniref:hypothetical protein n=1 Tax=uncultured Draconibacterium sp. TaxID=1573823 RepID=UPI0032164CD8